MKIRFTKEDILTIPNLLSLIRLLLVPLIAWLNWGAKNYIMAGVVVVISALTDVADGFIARKFNMISDLGKILDPIADKLTQAMTMLCLFTRFPHMLSPFILLVIKETVSGLTGIIRINKTKKVHGADWHGKLTTVFLFAMMLLHFFWEGIPAQISNGLIYGCCGMIILSGILYGISNIKAVKDKNNGTEKPEEIKEEL